MACLVFKHEFLATLKARPTDDSSAAVVVGVSELGGEGAIFPPGFFRIIRKLFSFKGLGLLALCSMYFSVSPLEKLSLAEFRDE